MTVTNRFPHILLASFAYMAILLSGCSGYFHEDLPPCGLDVRFVYDYNLKYADAFTAEVRKVTLFIFDDKGYFVRAENAEMDPFPEDYLLHLELPKGTYRFVAWAGLYSRSFGHPALIEGKSTIEDLRVSLLNASGVSDKEFDSLWHAYLAEVMVEDTPNQVVTMPLVKDTNVIRLVMIYTDKEHPIDANDYDFEIKCDNGAYTYRNACIPENLITYLPYFRENISDTEETGSAQNSSTTQTRAEIHEAAAVAELKTGRLMAGQPNQLRVFKKGVTAPLLDVNLNDFFSVLKLQAYSGMPMQEFLDRKDEYVITFFFTEGTSPETDFMSVQVMIDGWLVREQRSEL